MRYGSTRPGADPANTPGSTASAQPGPIRGVAAVPAGPPVRRDDTADMPAAEPPPTLFDNQRPRGRPVRPAQPGPPLIVRRRGRRLRSGSMWTWTGLSVVLVCWGIWLVSVRGSDLAGPVIGLVLVLGVGLLLFVVARMIGRVVLEGALGRQRPSAWPSHLTVCLFLVAAGVVFLQQTQWIGDSWAGLGDAWQWVKDTWGWGSDRVDDLGQPPG